MLRRLWLISASPLATARDQMRFAARSIHTSPGIESNAGVSTSSGPIADGPQLRAGEIQVVAPLEDVIREFVAGREARPARRAVAIDRCRRRRSPPSSPPPSANRGTTSASPCAAQHRPAAFVEPLRRDADDARRRPSAARAPAWNMRRLSVGASSVAAPSCIASRSRALPRCVRPVPDTRQRAGSAG